MRIQGPQASHFSDLFPFSAVAIPHRKTWRRFNYLARFRVKWHLTFSRSQGCLELSKRRLGTLSKCLRQAVTNGSVGVERGLSATATLIRKNGHSGVRVLVAASCLHSSHNWRARLMTVEVSAWLSSPFCAGRRLGRGRLSIHSAGGTGFAYMALVFELLQKKRPLGYAGIVSVLIECCPICPARTWRTGVMSRSSKTSKPRSTERRWPTETQWWRRSSHLSLSHSRTQFSTRRHCRSEAS